MCRLVLIFATLLWVALSVPHISEQYEDLKQRCQEDLRLQGIAQEDLRYDVFRANLAEIERINNQAGTWKAGVSCMTLYSEEQLQRMLGVRLPEESSKEGFPKRVLNFLSMIFGGNKDQDDEDVKLYKGDYDYKKKHDGDKDKKESEDNKDRKHDKKDYKDKEDREDKDEKHDKKDDKDKKDREDKDEKHDKKDDKDKKDREDKDEKDYKDKEEREDKDEKHDKKDYKDKKEREDKDEKHDKKDDKDKKGDKKKDKKKDKGDKDKKDDKEDTCRCRNGGVCDDDGKCQCKNGFSGVWCESKDCDTVCEHGGDCDRWGNCKCRFPYIGYSCENCGCKNNGTCADDFKCDCLDGFRGRRCEKEECDPECDNGVCVWNQDRWGNQEGKGRCRCRAGWTGAACDKESEKKCSLRCRNGRECFFKNKEKEMGCRCPLKTWGKTCNKGPRCAIREKKVCKKAKRQKNFKRRCMYTWGPTVCPKSCGFCRAKGEE